MQYSITERDRGERCLFVNDRVLSKYVHIQRSHLTGGSNKNLSKIYKCVCVYAKEKKTFK